MLIEALSLIVVVAVVLAANRLASANPPDRRSTVPRPPSSVVTALGAGVGYICSADSSPARCERLMKGAEEHVSHHHASEIVAATVGLLVGCVVAALHRPGRCSCFVRPTYVAVAISAFLALVMLTFTSTPRRP